MTNYLRILKRNGKIFDLICQTSSELNKILSGPILLELIINFIMITISLFIFICSIMNTDNNALAKITWMMLLVCVSNWLVVMILCSAADQPVFQVLF